MITKLFLLLVAIIFSSVLQTEIDKRMGIRIIGEPIPKVIHLVLNQLVGACMLLFICKIIQN